MMNLHLLSWSSSLSKELGMYLLLDLFLLFVVEFTERRLVLINALMKVWVAKDDVLEVPRTVFAHE